MKIVHIYNPDTLEYTGGYACPISPAEPGGYLEPIHFLEIAPMPAAQGKAIIKNGNDWQQVDDNRGVWYKPDGEIVNLFNLTDVPEMNWTREQPAPIIPPKTQFTSLEFLDRFTEEEQLAVVQATMVSAQVKLWYDRLLAASFVDISDPRTEAGIDALILAGLIEADRKSALLAPEVAT